MEIIKTLLWITEIISAIAIIILVLLQHGKGADAGATFGSGGGSGSLFGASGSSNFLSRTTAVFAAIFFISTFALVLLLSHGRVGDAGVMAAANHENTASGINMTSSGAGKTSGSNVVSSGVIGSAKTAKAENQIPQ